METSGKFALFNRRPMCDFALGLLGGILLFSVLPARRAGAAALIVLSLAALAFWTGRRRFALILFCAALGVARTMAASLPSAVPGTYALTGRIVEAPEKTDTGYRLTLSHVALNGENVRGRFYLDARPVAPAYGQTVSVTAAVSGVQRSNRWYAYAGVSGLAKECGDSYAVLENGTPDAYGALLTLRAFLSQRIDAIFPMSRGAARGMILGDKSSLDEVMSASLYGAGVGHLLAVSGIHTATLAGALLLAARRLRPGLRFLVLTLFLLMYSLLTACAPSVLRASLMLLTALAAPLICRRSDPLSSVSFAAIVILLIRPFALFYAGFQLSFLAALGIILISPLMHEPLKRLGAALSGTVSGSVAVTVSTLPSAALFFGAVPVMSVLTNVFVLPLFPLFLVPGFLLTALSCVHLPAARLLAYPPGLVLSAILSLCEAADKTALAIPAPSTPAFLFYLAALFAASRYCLLRPEKRARLFAALLLPALLLWR